MQWILFPISTHSDNTYTNACTALNIPCCTPIGQYLRSIIILYGKALTFGAPSHPENMGSWSQFCYHVCWHGRGLTREIITVILTLNLAVTLIDSDSSSSMFLPLKRSNVWTHSDKPSKSGICSKSLGYIWNREVHKNILMHLFIVKENNVVDLFFLWYLFWFQENCNFVTFYLHNLLNKKVQNLKFGLLYHGINVTSQIRVCRVGIN